MRIGLPSHCGLPQALPRPTFPKTAPLIDFGKDRDVRSSRERFLSEGVVSGRVRPAIAQSWRRSRARAVRADGELATSYSELDPEAPLRRLAEPILDRLAEEVADADMAVILTDPGGRVLDRRAGHALLRVLDRVLLAPGYFYAEQFVGTNGIGTAAEDRNTTWVLGSEHYAEGLRGLSGAGAIIRNPMTRQIEGVLDLTCRFEDTSPLMLPFINKAAREVERRLSEDMPSGHVAKVIQAVEERAALLERQRLARELHDSVSQALYGIALGIDTAQDLVGRAPEKVVEPLAFARELAETGMAEMRALIFGLRPELLEREGLVAGLARHVAALEASHGLSVEKVFGSEPAASLEVKEALLRIGQEALHNIAKHARAKHVHVRLATEVANLVLEIADDGVGFESRREFPGHLGLVSMQERMVRLGGRLQVFSSRGQGTRIRARVPVQPSQKSLDVAV